MAHSNATAAGIEAVVVDPADIITAFERNRDEDAKGRRHVLRVQPPFEGEVRAALHERDAGAAAPTEDSTPYDLPPELFVENYRGDDPERTTVRIPTLEASRQAARVDHGDAVDEATVEEYHEREMSVWRECVRDSLVDEVRVAAASDRSEEVWTEVRYEC